MFNKRLIEQGQLHMPKWAQWNLVWRKIEGLGPMNGINVYWKDRSSAGFVLRAGSVGLKVRWSKRVKKLFFGFQTYSFNDITVENKLIKYD